MTHPARKFTFDELWAGLKSAKAAGDVNEHIGGDGLSLFCYSKSCVYERHWDEMTMLARGIILDPAEKRVVATPFPKFFNAGERADSIPDLPFEVFEKMDGSLIILFHHKGEWRCGTKGSLGFRPGEVGGQLDRRLRPVGAGAGHDLPGRVRSTPRIGSLFITRSLG